MPQCLKSMLGCFQKLLDEMPVIFGNHALLQGNENIIPKYCKDTHLVNIIGIDGALCSAFSPVHSFGAVVHGSNI